MAEAPRLVLVGTAGATPIYADVSTRFITVKRVQLSVSYSTLCPPGYPYRPEFVGRDAKNLDYPRTIASGTTLSLFACEADALVTAGAATYV